eukprot:SAG11_NODE_6459_length_1309_cov_1.239669_1_plen_304_part_01
MALKMRDEEIIPVLQTQLKESSNQIELLSRECSSQNIDNTKLKNESDNLVQQMALVRNRLEDTTQVAVVLRNECKSIKEEREQLEQKLATAAEQLLECRSAKAELSQSQAELAQQRTLTVTATDQLEAKTQEAESLCQQNNESSILISTLESQTVALEKELSQTRDEKIDQQVQVDEMCALVEPLKLQAETLNANVARLEATNTKLGLKIGILEEHCTDGEKQQIDDQCDIVFERKQLEQQLDKVKSSTSNMSTELASLRNLTAVQELKLGELRLQLSDGETVRRKMHETISELKGNIKVFCRV